MADLVALFCKGEGERFRRLCKHYDTDADECRLLRGKPMKHVFEKGRCEPYEMLKRAVTLNLYEYTDRIDPKDHIEPTTFLTSVRIKEKSLTYPKLPVLKAYINRAAYNDVIELLITEGALWPRNCGVCVYLSWPKKPHLCQRAYITVDGEKVGNLHYKEKRNPSDTACKEGFQKPLIRPLPSKDEDDEDEGWEPGPSAESEEEEVIIILTMKKALSERADSATNENMRRKYERQYVVFCRFVQLAQEGYSSKDALKQIAEDLEVSLRTVERGMDDIWEFFKQVMSVDD